MPGVDDKLAWLSKLGVTRLPSVAADGGAMPTGDATTSIVMPEETITASAPMEPTTPDPGPIVMPEMTIEATGPMEPATPDPGPIVMPEMTIEATGPMEPTTPDPGPIVMPEMTIEAPNPLEPTMPADPSPPLPVDPSLPEPIPVEPPPIEPIPVDLPPIEPLPVEPRPADGAVPAGTTPTASGTDLFFERDSAALTASDQALLTAYAASYATQPSPPQVEITGYSSIDGQLAYNQKLSEARAKAAADFLVAQGVPKANVKFSGKGETDSFSGSDAAQNRRATLAPALSAAPAPPPAPPAPPAPPPTPPTPPAPPAPPPPAAIVLKHECEAPAPSNRQRTKLGVGERVVLKVTPGSGSWTVTGGTLSATSGASVTFTARATAGKSKVTVTAGGQSAEVEFDVIRPASVHMDTKGTRHVANGLPNAGIHTDIYIGPSDVSFYRCEMLELEVGATASGYWQPRAGQGHHPNANFGPMTQTVVSGKGTKFAFMDNALSGYLGPGPISAGQFAYAIPWQYRVVGGSSGTTFATVNQTIVTTADGTTTISKAGASASFKLTDGATNYAGAPY